MVFILPKWRPHLSETLSEEVSGLVFHSFGPIECFTTIRMRAIPVFTNGCVRFWLIQVEITFTCQNPDEIWPKQCTEPRYFRCEYLQGFLIFFHPVFFPWSIIIYSVRNENTDLWGPKMKIDWICLIIIQKVPRNTADTVSHDNH